MFGQLARRVCSGCGSSGLRWFRADDLVFIVEPADRKRVFELARFCGRDAEAWYCSKCSDWGVFAAIEHALKL